MAISPLQNKLRTSSGQLADVSSEELAAQTGRAAPTSPMENKVIGGNTDQAKMAGTPNQKTSALRQAIQGSASLQTRQRLQQPTTQISDAQQAQKDKLSELQALSGMEGRVGDLLNKQFSEASTLEGLQFNLENAPEEDRELLQKIQEGDTKAIAEYANKKGISAQQAAEEIKANYAIDSGISQQVSATTASLINNTEVDFTELGYESSDQVAELLGIGPEEFMNMNLGDTIDFINKKIEEEYSSADSLRAILDDPSVGPAEKADARQQLRDMGAVGIKAAESDAEQLADDVAQSKTIEFNGEKTTLDKILEDDYLEVLISNALQNEEFMDELEENEPGLAKFIQDNKDILTGISEQIDENTQMVIETTEANKALSGGLDDSIMKSIEGFENWDKVSDTALDGSTNSLISYINSPNLGEEDKLQIVKNLNNIAKTDPDLIQQIGLLSEARIKELGLDKADSKALDAIKLSADIKRLGDNPDRSQVLSILFPGKSSQESETELANVVAKIKSGQFENPGISLDANGNVDVAGLVNYYKNLNLNSSEIKDSLSNMINSITPTSSNYSLIEDYAVNGTLDTNGASKFAESATMDDLQTVMNDPALFGNMDAGTKSQITTTLQKRIYDEKITPMLEEKGYGSISDMVNYNSGIPSHKSFEDNKQIVERTEQAITDLTNIVNTLKEPSKTIVQKEINTLKSQADIFKNKFKKTPEYKIDYAKKREDADWAEAADLEKQMYAAVREKRYGDAAELRKRWNGKKNDANGWKNEREKLDGTLKKTQESWKSIREKLNRERN